MTSHKNSFLSRQNDGRFMTKESVFELNIMEGSDFWILKHLLRKLDDDDLRSGT